MFNFSYHFQHHLVLSLAEKLSSPGFRFCKITKKKKKKEKLVNSLNILKEEEDDTGSDQAQTVTVV